ncbi:integral membrane [Paramyrothecium foliicola]|nr:integral membrane [Paramyrothecium foliicola]
MASAPGSALISDSDENATGRIIGAVVAVTSLALSTVLSRAYVRLLVIRNMGWDDAIMIMTMAISIAGAAVALASCKYGAGKHIGDIPIEDRTIGLKLNFISQPIYLIGICTVKLSVGASLLRIASTKFYRTLILSIMGFITFYTIGSLLTIFLQCTDLRVLWRPSVPSVCWPQHVLQSLSYTSSTLNILTDLLFAVFIPAPMLWGLNVNFRTRLTLMAILGLGVFACSAAFVKLGYIVNYGKMGDFLWDSRNITIWTAAELNVGIIAGSLPTLRPLFKRILGSTYGKGSRKTPASGVTYNSHAHASRSKKHWRSFSSNHKKGERLDDASSQEGFNDSGVHSGYELDDRVSGSSEGRNTTTVLSRANSRGIAADFEDMVGEENFPAHGGIRATTVTRVEIESNKVGR